MSRSVTFNGITMYRPGGITRVNADALAQVSLLSNSIVGLIGEAEGGQPGVVTTIDDPALSKSTFVGGPLADAINLAFDPSNDENVPGGAFRCECLRVNQGTQSQVTLYSRVHRDTAASGSSTTVINLTTGGLTIDVHIGNVLRIGTEERPITDNAAGTVTVSPAFSTSPTIGQNVDFMTAQHIYKSRDYGAHTNRIKQEFESGSLKGSSWTTIFDENSQSSDTLGSVSYLDVEYVGQSVQIVLVSGTTDGAGGASEIVDSTKAWTINEFQNIFALVSGGALANPNLRKVASNTATAITSSAAFSSTPGIGATYSVRKGKIHSGTATAGAAATITLEATTHLAINELAGKVIYILGGTGIGQRRVITANTAGVSSVVTVSKNWVTQPVSGSTYEIRYVTECKASILGALGKASSFKTTVAYNGGTSATDLNISFSPNTTISDLVALIKTNSNYMAYVPNGINDKILMNTFDFDAGSTEVEIRNDKGADPTAVFPPTDPQTVWLNHFRRDSQVIVDDVNAKNEYVLIERSTAAAYGSGSGKPEFTGGVIGTIGDAFKYLSGGIRGTSDDTAWQTAFDEMAKVRINHVVPLICQDLTNEGYGSSADFASVAAQLESHVDYCNGAGKNERGGYIGMKGTLDQMVAQANSLASADVQLCGQRIQTLNVNGELTVFDEWALAVNAAGMRSGMPEVGEPLTHKYIKTTDLQQDSSWDPLDDTDANRAIQNGILFAENVKGKGIRYVRDLTTYIKSDNLAYAEGSVRDVVRYISYGLRTYLEDRFTGRKAARTNVSNIKGAAMEYLELCRSDNIIVDSEDADGVPRRAYYNLRVNISGDIARLRVTVFPVVGINFQLEDIYLQLPRLSA